MPTPIRSGTTPPLANTGSPSSVASTAEAGVVATTDPLTGLEAATAATPAPAGTVAPSNTVGSGVAAALARLPGMLATPSAGLLELNPGVPDAVSLPSVLKQLGHGPAAQQAVQGLITQLEATLGIKVPPALVAAALANPERLTDVLALSPAEMKKGFDAMHAAHAARQGSGGAPAAATGKPRNLPKRIALEDALKLPIARPPGDLKQLAPGLFHGDVPSALPDDQARRNLVLAEIFDRLAENATAAPADKFTLTFDGHTLTTLPGFLKALRAAGYSVEGEVAHRIADFAALKLQQPNGAIVDVPAAVMVKTGVKDASGAEAVLPAVHSEVVFHLRGGPNARGPKLDADLKWYQGVPNTGFFACDLMRKSPWTGTVVTERLNEAEATRAAVLAGALSDLINDVAQAAGLAMNGYGVTGVCNDSVAVIQQALKGRVTAYPLFMRDAVLLPELERRLRDRHAGEHAALRELKAAMALSPSDDPASPSAVERALASIPWPAGQETFASTTRARAILQHPGA